MVLCILAILGADLRYWIVTTVLILVLLAVEALDTAIEVIVDKISPERNDFARDAKDLGSAAVFLTVCANGIYLTAVILASVGAISF